MIGAIIGDVVGSRFERHNIKSKNFELFTEVNKFTDDTVMTLAVAKALMAIATKRIAIQDHRQEIQDIVVAEMQNLGKCYPLAGYGPHFSRWLHAENPQPYGSYGNGAAMRISPVAELNLNNDEKLMLTDFITAVSHDSPEGMKGAQALVAVITAAKSQDKARTRTVMADYYPIDFTLDEIRPSYRFDVSCEGSIPATFVAFLESESFEDAIRNAVSIGGDSDTIACMTGAIAEAFYQNIPDDMVIKALTYLPEPLRNIYREWQQFVYEE